ncbi:MAG: hypothetical protein C4520_08970 [Candidatus Abyssobacteria bacterium SURF_5]|uniref:Uncharacterized protein n=1 Tax=Abyssobacteria bacterium (strain SURF_5) TaxID=2093360 RepID=A0A3A4NSX9_ABYX5|nr:MAG: hypothetical protein C4520_08970 [Candidatus Abyssubacteria bacterium SURF_5]
MRVKVVQSIKSLQNAAAREQNEISARNTTFPRIGGEGILNLTSRDVHAIIAQIHAVSFVLILRILKGLHTKEAV